MPFVKVNMIHSITEPHINNVIKVIEQVRQQSYPRKKELFRTLALTLKDEEKYLIAFCLWHSVFNSKWYRVDASRFFFVKTLDKNKAQFKDFLDLLRRLKGQKNTKKKEAAIITFLGRCDKKHFGFYLQLLSKEWPKNLPMVQIQEAVNLDEVEPSEIYGELKFFEGELSSLNYPISITKISDPEAQILIHSRNLDNRIWQRTLQDGQLFTMHNNRFLRGETTYVKNPQFTLIGYLDKQGQRLAAKPHLRTRVQKQMTLHPFDYFSHWREFSAYYREGQGPELRERIARLNDFLQQNFTAQIRNGYVGLAENPTEVEAEVVKVVGSEDFSYLVIADRNSARTGDVLSVPARRTQAIIEGYWVQDEEVKGFEVWFNGKLTKCSFDFTGKNNSLLVSLDLIRHRIVETLLLDLGPLRMLTGLGIKWGLELWRRYPLKGTRIMIDKCCICGGFDHEHTSGGICRNCEINIGYYFKHYGCDRWIEPRSKTKRKREKNCWEPSLLEVCTFSYRGHGIEGDGEGNWRFKRKEPHNE